MPELASENLKKCSLINKCHGWSCCIMIVCKQFWKQRGFWTGKKEGIIACSWMWKSNYET